MPTIRSNVELFMRRQFWPRLSPLRPLSRTYPAGGFPSVGPDQLLLFATTGELLLFGAAGAVNLALAPRSLIPLLSPFLLLRTPANYSYSWGRRALCVALAPKIYASAAKTLSGAKISPYRQDLKNFHTTYV